MPTRRTARVIASFQYEHEAETKVNRAGPLKPAAYAVPIGACVAAALSQVVSPPMASRELPSFQLGDVRLTRSWSDTSGGAAGDRPAQPVAPAQPAPPGGKASRRQLITSVPFKKHR
jgi:hypothetical protein